MINENQIALIDAWYADNKKSLQKRLFEAEEDAPIEFLMIVEDAGDQAIASIIPDINQRIYQLIANDRNIAGEIETNPKKPLKKRIDEMARTMIEAHMPEFASIFDETRIKVSKKFGIPPDDPRIDKAIKKELLGSLNAEIIRHTEL